MNTHIRKITPGFLFPLLALSILVYGLSIRMQNLPPFGKLADPFIGLVQCENERALYMPRSVLGHTGIIDSVQVFFDDRRVPHIYARNIQDLYFAQGYVTAYLRLWQMDFLSYLAAGRVSEVVGDPFLNYDRNQRRLGILEAAEASLQVIAQHKETDTALTAYTDGVNAYIRTLTYKDLPLEYKFMDYKPEPWTKLKTVLLMKSMGNTLAGYEEDYENTNLMLALGEKQFNFLFPDFDKQGMPETQDQTTKPNPSLLHTEMPAYLNYSFLSRGTVGAAGQFNPRLGSNSWVVSGRKTVSGHPILSCDPHLNLTLPSLWLEMQLTAPGLNVYGVSIPGTPSVIIGFNEHIAWGLTNGQDDVKDWYKLNITNDYKLYQLDGEWLPLKHRIEKIEIRGRKPLLDTVYQSIQGPIVSDKSFPGPRPELLNHAMHWELDNASDEFLTFIKLSRTRDYVDFQDAIRTYTCPILNFTFISRDGDIALKHQGHMTLKKNGEGRFILDGTDTRYISGRYIPEDSLPSAFNPPSGVIVSANQHPTGTSYPYYYNGYFHESRAIRIHQLLEDDSLLTIQKMMAAQLDNSNSFAVSALPILLKNTDTSKLTPEEKKAFAALSHWNGAYEAADKNAKLFDLWWQHIKEDTWDEFKAYSFHAKLPDDYVLLDLIEHDPGNTYFDRQGTDVRETAGDIIRESFRSAYSDDTNLNRKGRVTWADNNQVFLMHMMNIRAFSRRMGSAGCPNAINATSSGWGPSWRMIVEMGDWPVAYGIYPGGESGHVRGCFYADFVDHWNKGAYYPLRLYRSKEEARSSAVCTWILK
jgi:penicillin amidase